MAVYRVAISKYALDRKIPPGDAFWREFNASFENVELDTNTLIDYVYGGYSMTTWHANHWRTSSNFICGQTIGLDFDTEDERSKLSTLVKDKFISKYAAFIHTTTSHKEESPRARVIFTLDQPIYQAKNYVLAASALLWVFGTADRACRDAVRFWYGAKDCKAEYLNQVLPLDMVKKLIGQYQESGQLERKQATNKNYLVPPSQQEVADALRVIPPWGVDYDEWLQVLMGIHAAFGEDGLGLVMSWADGKPGEVEQKWRSFDGTGGVTVATVFGIAKKFGWKKAM